MCVSIHVYMCIDTAGIQNSFIIPLHHDVISKFSLDMPYLKYWTIICVYRDFLLYRL